MKNQGYNRIIEDLRKEGSYEEYYKFLLENYGGASYSTIYQGLDYQHNQCKSGLNKDEFVETALVEDLYHKDVEKLYMIAEAEKEYSDRPLFIALDRYYKINPSLDDTKETIESRVKEIEDNKV